MSKLDEVDEINEMLLEAHKLSVQLAVETAIRTGTSLIVNKNGKIVSIKPKYKYILVPIKPRKRKASRKK